MPPDYSKEGFELVWKNGGETFAFDTAIDSDLNLVAEFSPVMLSVTVQDADGLRLDEVEVACGHSARTHSLGLSRNFHLFGLGQAR